MTGVRVTAISVQMRRAELLSGAVVFFAASQGRIAALATPGRLARAAKRADQIDAFDRIGARVGNEALVDIFAAVDTDEADRTDALVAAVRLFARRPVHARIRCAVDERRTYWFSARFPLVARLTHAHKALCVGERELSFSSFLHIRDIKCAASTDMTQRVCRT